MESQSALPSGSLTSSCVAARPSVRSPMSVRAAVARSAPRQTPPPRPDVPLSTSSSHGSRDAAVGRPRFDRCLAGARFTRGDQTLADEQASGRDALIDRAFRRAAQVDEHLLGALLPHPGELLAQLGRRLGGPNAGTRTSATPGRTIRLVTARPAAAPPGRVPRCGARRRCREGRSATPSIPAALQQPRAEHDGHLARGLAVDAADEIARAQAGARGRRAPRGRRSTRR